MENTTAPGLLAPGTTLQCGHGSDAVENLHRPGRQTRRRRLQCGHGSDAVENRCGKGEPGSGSWCFNAATAVTPWRTERVREKAAAIRMLQCGHGSDAVENSTCRRDSR